MGIIDFVKGSQKVFGIIGNPVEHSFSPVLQNTIGALVGGQMVYVPFPVEKGQVRTAMEGGFALGIEGFNVTVPHKIEVMDALIEIDSVAKQIGAVNTLKRGDCGYKGYNTDILGMEKSLSLGSVHLNGKHVAVLGAGGAAHAAVILAASRGVSYLSIVNRTVEKAVSLKNLVNQFYPTKTTAMDYEEFLESKKPDIIIQTTSFGMGNDVNASPIRDAAFLKGIEAVLDIIYTPWETKFLKDARAYGVKAFNGFDMLLFQGIASYEIWNDIVIEDSILQKLRNELTSYYRKGFL